MLPLCGCCLVEGNVDYAALPDSTVAFWAYPCRVAGVDLSLYDWMPTGFIFDACPNLFVYQLSEYHHDFPWYGLSLCASQRSVVKDWDWGSSRLVEDCEDVLLAWIAGRIRLEGLFA